MKQLYNFLFDVVAVIGEPLLDTYICMILLIKGVITRNYIYDLKHLNVIKKIQKSFLVFMLKLKKMGP